MRNLDLNECAVQEMKQCEMNEIDGGIWQFVAGAIIGGILYDVAKAAAIAVYNSPTNQKMLSEGFDSRHF